jgi:hypothetical protein
MWKIHTFLCFVVLSLAGWAELSLQNLRDGDRAEVRDGKVIVYSQTGIGYLTVRPNGAWPQRLRFRFCYQDGTGLTRMEGLSIQTESLEVKGSWRNEQQIPFRFTGSGDASGLLYVDFRVVDGALELTLPEGFAQGDSLVNIHWVDAYRN